jgi:hypothetical protein
VSDGILTILKLCLLALVYLFLLRVVWVVNRELKGTPTVVISTAAPADARRRKRPWSLAIVEPKSNARAFEVDGELTIGRAGGCAVPLPDDTFVSQVHARVFERDGDAWVEDLASTNGTLVNGAPLREPQRLRRGDRIQVGSTVLEASR